MLILEGTDAVGKSTVIKNLSGYDLYDRDKNISHLFDLNISLIERVEKLKEYLTKKDNHLIILVNNDREEIERRINLREKIDEYDRFAYLYNMIYLETYLYIEQKGLLKDRVFLVDCTDLNEEEEKNKVKEIVDYILNNSNDKIAKNQI